MSPLPTDDLITDSITSSMEPHLNPNRGLAVLGGIRSDIGALATTARSTLNGLSDSNTVFVSRQIIFLYSMIDQLFVSRYAGARVGMQALIMATQGSTTMRTADSVTVSDSTSQLVPSLSSRRSRSDVDVHDMSGRSKLWIVVMRTISEMHTLVPTFTLTEDIQPL